MSSYLYRILPASYLHNGLSYTGKTTSLYWIRAHVPVSMVKDFNSLQHLNVISMSRHHSKLWFNLMSSSLLYAEVIDSRVVTVKPKKNWHLQRWQWLWTSRQNITVNIEKVSFTIYLWYEVIQEKDQLCNTFSPGWIVQQFAEAIFQYMFLEVGVNLWHNWKITEQGTLPQIMLLMSLSPHKGWDKMDIIYRMTYSNAFSSRTSQHFHQDFT